MRWLVATDDLWPVDGGVATWTALVAEALADEDEVTVLARARPGLPERLGRARVIGVRGPSFGRWGGWWTAAAALGRRADRVLATTWPVASALVHGPWPVDVVWHGSDATRPARGPRGRVERLAARHFAVSGYLRDVLADRGVPATVLPAPIAPEPLDPPTTLSSAVFLGRLTREKGLDRFAALVAALGVAGTVIGDGPAPVDPRLRRLGRLPRAAAVEALRGHAVAVLLPRPYPDGSGAEGLGLALLEARARGIAVVGCRTGGVPEAVGPGLVLDDPDDAVASAAAIRAWWTPARGAAGWTGLAGPAATAAALRTASPPG